MKRLSGRVPAVVLAATFAGALVAALVAAVPASAGAGEEPRTVTVRAECVGGGAIVLRQTADRDSTHVEIRGRGLGEETRWRGSHLLEVGVDDTVDTSLSLVAVGGRLRTDLDLDDTGAAAVLDLRHGKRHCFASYDENRPFVIVGSARLSALVRRTEDGYLARTELDRCRPGSRWFLDLGIGSDDGGVGAGRGADCSRHGWLRSRWDFGVTPHPTERPTELTFQARGQGSRERLTYRATRPPVD